MNRTDLEDVLLAIKENERAATNIRRMVSHGAERALLIEVLSQMQQSLNACHLKIATAMVSSKKD